MKRWFVLAFCAMAVLPLFGQSGEEQAARQARSVHLQHFGWGEEAKIFYIEATADHFWRGSYMCLLGFHGGYAGVQELTNGAHVAIFSVWEPSNPQDFTARADDVEPEIRTRELYHGEGVRIRRFGGEGSGGQSMVLWAWKLKKPVCMAISAAADGEDRTAYTCWLWIEEQQAWFRMATFSTLVGGEAATLREPYSFLEDFLRDVDSRERLRAARFSRLWAYCDERWVASDTVLFSADNNLLKTIDAGPWGGGAWLATGADMQNITVPLWRKFKPGSRLDDSAERRAKLLACVIAAEAEAVKAEPATAPTEPPAETTP